MLGDFPRAHLDSGKQQQEEDTEIGGDFEERTFG